MGFASPLWFIAGAVGALAVLALHVLRPRREPVMVSSTLLWREHAAPLAAVSPWQKLRWSLPLVAQLLTILLLSAAIANPVRKTTTPLSKHTVFLVDTSASMGATDTPPTRVGAAVARAVELRKKLPPGGIASIVTIERTPRVVLSGNDSEKEFENAIRSLKPTFGTGDFSSAFALAEGLETTEGRIGFVLLSDGRLTEPERRLLPLGTRYEPIGARTNNRGIIRLTTEVKGSGLHVRATIRSYGGPDVKQTLRIDADGKTVARKVVSIKSKATVDADFDIPGGERIEAILDAPPQGAADLLDIDDTATAVASGRRSLKILKIGPRNVFLDAALDALPSVTVERAETTPAKGAGGFDAVVFDGVDVPANLGAPALVIAPPKGLPSTTSGATTNAATTNAATTSGSATTDGATATDATTEPAASPNGDSNGAVRVLGTSTEPSITTVQTDDPLLNGLDLSEVVVASAQQLDVAGLDAIGGNTLIGAEGAPLLARTRNGRWPVFYLAFRVGDSNLPLQVAFPVLIDRMMAELGGGAAPSTSATVGDPLDVRLLGASGALALEDPGRRPVTVDRTSAPPLFDKPGFWKLTKGTGTKKVVQWIAVNVPATESDVRVEKTLPVATAKGSVAVKGLTTRSQRHWLIPLLLGLLLVEFLLIRKRVGVTRKQWRFAVASRVVLASLLAIALVAPNLRIRTNRVATVFAVDASDSLGATGRRQALDAVSEALKKAPKGSSSGVVLFGGDARILATVRKQLELSGASVVVDGSRTDLAAGLRLAGAVTPGDAKRRVVLISDGRRTVGSEIDVARSLREAGIRVDTIPIGGSVGDDSALSGIDAPSKARAGEQITIRARVSSTVDQSVSVAMFDEKGVEIGRKEVAVKTAEEVAVDFSTVLKGSGLARYSMETSGTQNSVIQNDNGTVAIEVLGPARVLVVEGKAKDASIITSSLTARGIPFDVLRPELLGDEASYIPYNAIVFANVPIASISSEQVNSLRTAVRELGRGFVVIGGNNAYGPGGYLGSDLEELLPVVSDVQDPLRRKTVAEVLAIDSSGSMAACHCDDAAGDRIGGGVIKTDIARAGAVRAIETLQPTDEIGVLTVDDRERWVIGLGPTPTVEVAAKKLESVKPGGATNLGRVLAKSAEGLRKSTKALKHIVLFTDGFTNPGVLDQVAADASKLRAEGITISVVATGEGAFADLEKISTNGGGRFYPGRDLREIPRILVDESQIAARSLINEGSFLPTVTSSAATVRSLKSAPILKGFVATTAKPTARTLLRVGPEDDPLLVTWQAGLGKVTSWTSDANGRWSTGWANWGTSPDFFAGLIKDTFPITTGGDAKATIQDDVLGLRVSGAEAWPDAVTASAQVRGPDGVMREVRLDRIDASTFAAELPADQAGSYTAGIQVNGPSGRLLTTSALVNASYSPEYRLGPNDQALLQKVSRVSGGRGVITAAQAFDGAGLVRGTRRLRISWPLLFAAFCLFPFAVALWRLRFRKRNPIEVAQEAAAVASRAAARSAAIPNITLGRGKRESSPTTSTVPNADTAFPHTDAANAAKANASTVSAPPQSAPTQRPLTSPSPATQQQDTPSPPKAPQSTPPSTPAPTTSDKPAQPPSAPTSSGGSTVEQLLARKRQGKS